MGELHFPAFTIRAGVVIKTVIWLNRLRLVILDLNFVQSLSYSYCAFEVLEEPILKPDQWGMVLSQAAFLFPLSALQLVFLATLVLYTGKRVCDAP
jgi:hypothetical protein